MKVPYGSLLLLLGAACALLLPACSDIHSEPVSSSGTPVAPWANPGDADRPDAAATGAQPRQF